MTTATSHTPTNWTTPPRLATLLAEAAGIRDLHPGARVLEPSAGDGALVDAALAMRPGIDVLAIEPDHHRAAALRARDRTVAPCRLQTYAAHFMPAAQLAGGIFHAALMHAPLVDVADPDDPHPWLTHLHLTLPFLRRGARLAALVPLDRAGIYSLRGRDAHELLTRPHVTYTPVAPTDLPPGITDPHTLLTITR
jgi:hypothetical protein